MPDWLRDSLHEDVRVATDVLLIRLAASFAMGCVTAGVYRLTGRSDRTSWFPGSLVLLSVLIAVVTLVIGNSIARAFSLVGALAIVRFRTVVEDTRDTAFVLFAVAAGMSCGAGFPAASAASVPLIVLACWLFRPVMGSSKESEQTLALRMGTGSGVEQRVQALLTERLPDCRLTGLATVRGGAALDMKYLLRALTAEEALVLVAELNRIEGVQSVELKSG
jgi:uncharacterized membrane protein YhiD involved in acid resistance